MTESAKMERRDIVPVGRLANGLGLYRYRYLWSDTDYVGVMAQEVELVRSDAVVRGSDGYLRVDYDALGRVTKETDPAGLIDTEWTRINQSTAGAGGRTIEGILQDGSGRRGGES